MGALRCFMRKLMLHVLISYLAAFQSTALAASFWEYFQASGDADHVRVAEGGHSAQIVLDAKAASGFGSKDLYLFGSFSLQMKLVPEDSAGTVLAYYMSSNFESHDEIDFEFLGNSSGQPYVVQTNIYAKGVGGREERMNLWFDPTTSFHTYTILWNEAHIIFYVDAVPIRIYRNNEEIGVPYLSHQPMNLFASLWNGDSWATRGGAVKLNWTHAPFVASYRNFEIDGCIVSSRSSIPDCLNNSIWNQEDFQILSDTERNSLQATRENYMIYDYCVDKRRYPTTPPECASNAAIYIETHHP